mmetsp:Transcript_33312/g.81879  ORF Transcript_33312/g.81879 Transcript_33312/m.81879 type:complete len:205 (+) Transcript_33312:193-807(+)
MTHLGRACRRALSSPQMECPAPASSFQYVSMDARMQWKGLPWMVLLRTVVAPPQWYAACPLYVALLCSRCVSSSRISPCQLENAPPRVAWLSSRMHPLQSAYPNHTASAPPYLELPRVSRMLLSVRCAGPYTSKMPLSLEASMVHISVPPYGGYVPLPHLPWMVSLRRFFSAGNAAAPLSVKFRYSHTSFINGSSIAFLNPASS